MKLMHLYEDVALVSFGKELKRILRKTDALQVLDREPSSRGSDWTAGGCYVLSIALLDILPGSELWGIFRNGGVGIEGKADHFAVKFNDMYIDGDGVSSESLLLKRFARDYPDIENPVLKKATPNDVHPYTPSDLILIKNVKNFIEGQIESDSRFGKSLYNL